MCACLSVFGRFPAAFVAILGTAVLSQGAIGCVATVEERPARIFMSAPPPPPLVEPRTMPPGATHVWVDGYWHWNGVQYVWIPGHWEQPPPGRVWVAPRYMSLEGRYVYHPGAWHATPRTPAYRP